MKKKSQVFKFGEDVENYNIPVLNEREIRASAGILFLFMFISFMMILFKENFLLIKYVIVIFLTDLLIRVYINPKYAPTLIAGRLIVSKQAPEYVGAPQKKFAWKIGIVLASLMFVLLVVVNSYSIITGLGCLTCLVFLFFESAFGICLGCLVYNWFYKTKTQYCAGEVCGVSTRQDIQQISRVQICILVSLLAVIILMIFFFNDAFSKSPRNLWAMVKL